MLDSKSEPGRRKNPTVHRSEGCRHWMHIPAILDYVAQQNTLDL
jgi:hypothetical protein